MAAHALEEENPSPNALALTPPRAPPPPQAYLPEKVDEARGRAQWDGAKEELSVTLPVVPALDSKLATSVSDELD